MLLILEDNGDKVSNLLLRYPDKLTETSVICKTVKAAQYFLQKMENPEPFELWLDNDLGPGGNGIAFLSWCIESKYQISKLFMITLSISARHEIYKIADKANIPWTEWGGPFG